MQVHSRSIRILAATGVIAVTALAAASPGNARTTPIPKPTAAKQTAAVLTLRVDRDGEWYVFLVNGAPRGLAFR
jgi:hypothetical protein